MLFSRSEADEFFKALRAASVEFLEWCNLPVDQGRKRCSSWKEGGPIGVTEHYTAGVTWKGTINWLNEGTVSNSVSCQMLILDQMIPDYRDIASKYPELSGLKVTVILLSDGIVPCWHAGWVNRFTFGIENRNAGRLKYDDGQWYWWAKNWQAKFPMEKLSKKPASFGGTWWEPYTHGQICANILVCQMLYCLYPQMSPSWFLPHSATTGTKHDTGLAFPLHKVRNAVFGLQPLEDLIWLHDFRDVPRWMGDYAESEDRDFVHEMALRQRGRFDDEGFEEDLSVMETPPEADLQLLVEAGNWRKELGAIRRALHRLGYEVPATPFQTLDKDTALAVYQFQRSKGLKADKIPGSITQLALVRRLEQFNLM